MSIIDKLERRFGKYSPQNITNILLAGQGISYLLVYSHPEFSSYFYLSGRQIFQGQLWRLITILIAPVSDSLLFAVLALYFFYLFGNALENEWGSFRYLIYIAVSYIGTLVFILLFPNYFVSNVYIYTSLFLAFAHLYPNFRLLLFFIIPVKVKWLGYLAWLGLFLTFLSGSFPMKIFILFSVSNFLFFFSEDIKYSLFSINRSMRSSSKIMLQKRKPHHICTICGKNEIDNPDMEIRYCSQCEPETCYCGEHIHQHQHKRYVN